MIQSNLGVVFSDKLLKEGISNIAIYGYTEITKIIINLLKDSQVKIAYIVNDKPIAGLKVAGKIGQGVKEYPPVDLMFAAEPWNSAKTITDKFHKLRINIPVVDASDYLIKLKEKMLQ